MNAEGDHRPGQQRKQDAEEAAAWFARLQAGTADRDAFERWRSNPAHALAFARATAAWEAACEPDEQPHAVAVVTRRNWLRGGIASAVAAAAGSGLLATRAYAWDSASTAIGETRKLRLSDGSMLVLNTDTEVFWRFSRSRRELWLERGEVALDLVSGPLAQLYGGPGRADLSAGRFNARLRAEALDLMVLRGQALAAGPAAPLRISANHSISALGGKSNVAPLSRDAAEAALAWQSGDVVFLDTPLSDAVAEYNRYLLRPIVIDDASVGAIRVGGRFVSSDPSDFLNAVSTSLGLKVRATASNYHLSR